MFKIYNCNEKKLLQQKGYLKKEIIEGNNATFFKVIDLECGTGKTVTAEEALSEISMNMDKKVLFVRERNDDCIASAEKINQLVGKTVAIAVNSNTYNVRKFNKIKKDLVKYSVVIITHEKYKALSIDKQNRKYFKEDRQILVIDEFLNMAKGHELSIHKNFIRSFETLLNNRTLRQQYVLCVQEIEDYLMSNTKLHSFFNSKKDFKDIKKVINKLKRLVKDNLKSDYVKGIGYKSKKALCNKIDELKQFYIQTCIVEGDTMYCVDRNYQYWLLDNNIILDASARLNQAYKLNERLFHVQHQVPVLDHSKWSFFIVPTNSSKSAKARAVNFYEVVNRVIEKNNSQDTLIIGNIADEDGINTGYINHFGNITGSNEYKDLSNVVVTHNPNVPFRIYILEWLFYSGTTLDNKTPWDGINDGKGHDRVYRFKDERFESYRQNKNANELYQAVKRVNRNMIKDSKVIIFNNDSKTIETFTKMFKDCSVTYIKSNPVKYEPNKMDNYNADRKENRKATKFISLCKGIMDFKYLHLQQQKKNRKGEYEIVKGSYTKQTLSEYLGIKDKNNFRKTILDDLEVIDFMDRHKIINKGQAIDFTQVMRENFHFCPQ